MADVVRECGAEFVARYRPSDEQRWVLRAIERCRTTALGGHRRECEACGHQHIAYNSCSNRHCPKCQGKERREWVEAEVGRLLPVDYFHVVFPLPHDLNPIIRVNRRLLYGLLFKAASATLRQFARTKLKVDDLAITAVLHTWGQTLIEHVHLHCLVSAGGLSRDGKSFRRVPKRRRPFLFPVKALSRSFRRRFLAALRRLHRRGKLCFTGESAYLTQPACWETLLEKLQWQDWVVYAKPPFGSPAQVLKYLGRYTHRIAISNRRLLFVGNGVVRFRYFDYADGKRVKDMALPAGEFLRRFLLHVLPTGFMRIRHYGLLANANRDKLARCRELLGIPVVNQPDAHTTSSGSADSADRCPLCGGRLRVVEILHPEPHDTS
ncbi:MAG: IS91 family transposase [Polyangiaceae bacterium]|nr:IS91 family transposase [Polyangiaceae bacterium]